MHAWLTHKVVANVCVIEKIVRCVVKRSRTTVNLFIYNEINSESLSIAGISQRDVLYCPTKSGAMHLILCRAMPKKTGACDRMHCSPERRCPSIMMSMYVGPSLSTNGRPLFQHEQTVTSTHSGETPSRLQTRVVGPTVLRLSRLR